MSLQQFFFLIVLPIFLFFFIKEKIRKHDAELDRQHEKEKKEREIKEQQKRIEIELEKLETQKKSSERIKKINYLLDEIGSELHSLTVVILSEKYPYLPIHITDANLKPLLFDGFKETNKIKEGIYKGLLKYANFVVSVYLKENNLRSNKPINFILLEYKPFWINEIKNRITINSNDPADWDKRREVVFLREQAKCQRCGLQLNLYDKSHVHHILPRKDMEAMKLLTWLYYAKIVTALCQVLVI